MLDCSQIEEFKRLYPVTAKRELMSKLGITSSILKNTAHRLGLRKIKGYKIRRSNPLSWPEEEIELFVKIYPVTKNAEIAKRLKKTIPQVKNRAHAMGLLKAPEFIAEHGGRFKPGHDGWTCPKGVHLSPATEFKKGSVPHNTKFDGCITTRINKDGRPYKFIRISKGKWIHLHRFLWSLKNGKVPAGHVVRFIDGNSLNVNESNLECVSFSRHQNIVNPAKAYVRKYMQNLKNIPVEYLRAVKKYKGPRPPLSNRPRQGKLRVLPWLPVPVKLKKRPGRKIDPNSAHQIKIRRLQKTKKKVGNFVASDYDDPLMKLGKQNFGFAMGLSGNFPDKAKDLIMQSICYFLEAGLHPDGDFFRERLKYENKLMNKHSYKHVRFEDVEFAMSSQMISAAQFEINQ